MLLSAAARCARPVSPEDQESRVLDRLNAQRRNDQQVFSFAETRYVLESSCTEAGGHNKTDRFSSTIKVRSRSSVAAERWRICASGRVLVGAH